MNNLEWLCLENLFVICYINDVVKNFIVNGLLSLGVSFVMSEVLEEVEDFIWMVSVFLINIGIFICENEEDIIKIGKIVN